MQRFAVVQLHSCVRLCNLMDCSTPGLPVHHLLMDCSLSDLPVHHLPEFSHVHIHCISDAIQPSHPLTPLSPSALDLSQHQGLFQ